tara:strand:+ start:21 stop:596 length:576 start_codon:yes stop_codon:yes gene_type:complete
MMNGYMDFTRQEEWLKRYYFFRAGFAAAWAAVAFTLGCQSSILAMTLLVVYPAWDAVANVIDAERSDGWGKNRVQATNVFISVLATIAVVVALQMSNNSVLAVFGAWAILSGLLQLGSAVGRWKRFEAPWAMIMMLSGAQSAWAGVFFIWLARSPEPPLITNVAGYAALGAIYFLISAIWMCVSDLRHPAS